VGLEIDRAHRFHHRELTVQRIGVLVVVGFLLAAVLGAFGGAGPLSSTVRPAADAAFDLAYHRFVHRETDERLTISVAGEAVTQEYVDLEVAASWLDKVQVTVVTPEPDTQTGAAGGVRFRLPADPGAPLTVGIHFRAIETGPLDGWVRVVPGERTSFTQYVFP